MVQLVIRLPDNTTDTPEWALIELQGDLETRTEESSLNGKFIGDLHFNKKGAPILIIGHHIFQGKVVTMEKPFAVITKETGTESSDTAVHSQTEYLVRAIIKKKLLFNNRPKPIIAHVPKKV